MIRRLTLLPLVLFIALTFMAAGVGLWLHDGSAGAVRRDAAPLDLDRPECRTGTPARGTPWSGAARATSEATFLREMSREGRVPATVEGKDGFVFWDDVQAQNFSQALGRVSLTDAQVDGWTKRINRLQRIANNHGSAFAVVVAPAKWEIYDDKLPAWSDSLVGERTLDRLLAASPHLPVIDVRGALADARQEHDTYSPLNSHWTDFGGYVAWRQVLDCLHAAGTATDVTAPDLDGVDLRPERSEFADRGFRSSDRTWTVPVLAGKAPRTSYHSLANGSALPAPDGAALDLTQLPARTVTNRAQDAGTMLVLRDSTGSALSPLWNLAYRNVVQVAHEFGPKAPRTRLRELEATWRPDLTLLVVTERYLPQVDAATR